MTNPGCRQLLFSPPTGKGASCTGTLAGEVDVQKRLKQSLPKRGKHCCGNSKNTGGSLERRNALDLPEEIENNKEQASWLLVNVDTLDVFSPSPNIPANANIDVPILSLNSPCLAPDFDAFCTPDRFFSGHSSLEEECMGLIWSGECLQMDAMQRHRGVGRGKLLKQSVMRTVALHCSTALCEQMLSRDLCHFYQHAGGRVEAGNI